MKSYRILIVDDNEKVRSTIRFMLIDEYVMEEASNGQEALEKIAQNKPDIILLDMIP